MEKADNKEQSINTDFMILTGLVNSEKYTRKVLPHLKSEYFESQSDKVIFDIIHSYSTEYNSIPTKETLQIDLSKNTSIPQNIVEEVIEKTEKMFSEQANASISKLSHDWLIDKTEQHCKDASIYNSVMESLSIIEGTHKTLTKHAIPEIFRKALSISFDSSIGHDYFEDYEKRFEYYHRKEEKIELPLDMLNKITKGGLSRKTLNMIIAPTGVGKTFFMTYCSSHFLMQGRNVLYLTLEMDEESISKRVDAALLDTTLDNLHMYPKDTFASRIQGLKKKTSGRLIVQQYPPGSASVAHFRFLIDELRIKKNFVPDVIVIDYLNLCASSRIKNRDNSYTYVKSIAEEVRGLGIEYDCAVLSASQSNRSAQNASDYDLNEVSESHGLSMTADWMIGLISTEELEKMNQLRIKLLKNRYGEMNPKSFIVGITRAKMQLFNADTGGFQKQIGNESKPDKLVGNSSGGGKLPERIPPGKLKF